MNTATYLPSDSFIRVILSDDVGYTASSVCQYIKQIGWEFESSFYEYQAAWSVNIAFFCGKYMDQTQFDIDAYAEFELDELFQGFCKENRFTDVRITNINVVAAAADIELLP